VNQPIAFLLVFVSRLGISILGWRGFRFPKPVDMCKYVTDLLNPRLQVVFLETTTRSLGGQKDGKRMMRAWDHTLKSPYCVATCSRILRPRYSDSQISIDAGEDSTFDGTMCQTKSNSVVEDQVVRPADPRCKQ
jgi:hypothetical protein